MVWLDCSDCSGGGVSGRCKIEQESDSQCNMHHDVKSAWRAVGIGNLWKAEEFWIRKRPRAKGAL